MFKSTESFYEEQFEEPGSVNLTDQWDTIEEAKIKAKVFLLDRGESWAKTMNSNQRHMNLHCKRKDICDFYLHVGPKKGQWAITVYRPYTCHASIHYNFRQANSAFYNEYVLQ